MNQVESKPKRGLFIAIEGLDGSGKTTLCAALVAQLQTQGAECISTREPGGTPFSESLREILKSPLGAELSHTTQALLVSAARRDHVEKVIQPALTRGICVISDRYTLSTRVFQPTAVKLDALISIGSAGLVPDLTIVLDVDYDTSKVRQTKVLRDHFDNELREFFDRRRDTVRQLCHEAQFDPHFYYLDASSDIDTVYAAVYEIVNRYVKHSN